MSFEDKLNCKTGIILIPVVYKGRSFSLIILVTIMHQEMC